MSSFDPISIFRDITLGDLQSPCGNLPHLNWKIRFEPSLVLRCIFFHPNIYNPSCWVVFAVRSGISAVRSSSLHMPLTTKRARELFLLPFQSCERCPGKSSHISPWVQMVARPKYALQRHTDILKKKNIEKEETALWLEKSHFSYFHSHKHPTCVVHGVWEKVWSLRAQAESSYRVTVAVHVVDQLVLPQVPHLHNTNTQLLTAGCTKGRTA